MSGGEGSSTRRQRLLYTVEAVEMNIMMIVALMMKGVYIRLVEMIMMMIDLD